MCCVLRLKRSIDFDYYIEDHKLLEVTEQADLGIIISNDLKPSKHITKVASKANQRLGMIRRCFSNHSSDVIKPLYQAIVHPIIEYNSPVWNPWLLKDIQELDKVQKRCLKLCSTNIDLLTSGYFWLFSRRLFSLVSNSSPPLVGHCLFLGS